MNVVQDLVELPRGGHRASHDRRVPPLDFPKAQLVHLGLVPGIVLLRVRQIDDERNLPLELVPLVGEELLDPKSVAAGDNVVEFRVARSLGDQGGKWHRRFPISGRSPISGRWGSLGDQGGNCDNVVSNFIGTAGENGTEKIKPCERGHLFSLGANGERGNLHGRSGCPLATIWHRTGRCIAGGSGRCRG